MPYPQWKKLSLKDEELIYKLWNEDKIAQEWLAQRFGVSWGYVHRLLRRKKREENANQKRIGT